MEDTNRLVKASELIQTCNELLAQDLCIKVFGLPYPPYHEFIQHTDVRSNRIDYMRAGENLSLHAPSIATKLKVKTITGFSSLFTYVGPGEYRLNLSNKLSWVHVPIRNIKAISYGMLLSKNGENLGMIIGILDDIAKENNLIIQVADRDFHAQTILIDLSEPVDYNQYEVLDRVIRYNPEN